MGVIEKMTLDKFLFQERKELKTAVIRIRITFNDKDNSAEIRIVQRFFFGLQKFQMINAGCVRQPKIPCRRTAPYLADALKADVGPESLAPGRNNQHPLDLISKKAFEFDVNIPPV
jgi:hypothetical protein